MTRSFTFAFLGACALALCATPLLAQDAQSTSQDAKAAPPGTETLDTGETRAEAEAKGDSVAAIVNDTVITEYDLKQRMGLYLATTNARTTPEIMKQIRQQILQQLETERIELLEAQKNNITVSAADVDRAIDNILKDNHMTLDQLTAMLGRSNVRISTLRSQIASQVAWSKTVQNQYGDRVDVSPQDVTDEMRRLAEGRTKPHFLVAEIFQPVDNPEDDAKVLKSMQSIEEQLRSGASFGDVARQFSQNPTAASGGDLGLVVEGQLPKELDDALRDMRPGTLSQPIRSSGGYYILLLRGRQEGEGTKLDDQQPQQPVNAHPDSLPLARILLPIGPKPPKALLDKVAEFANDLRSRIGTCDGLSEAIQKIKGAVYMNLGTMRLADLSPQIQQQLAQTTPGGTTVPFQSAAGVEIFVRCDKGPPPKASVFQMPSRDDVEQQIFEERMGVLSRQYLRDLRRDADIEKPGEPLGPRKAADVDND